MKAIVAGDRDAFLNYEVKTRQSGLLPPYGRLAAIVISARDKALTEVTAREIARRAPPSDVISVLGPVEAPIAVVRGRHRWRLLVKAPRDVDLQGYLRAWAGTIPKLKSDVRVTVDIDPYNFL
jgi:primosomal protein N' (replication factor Y)